MQLNTVQYGGLINISQPLVLTKRTAGTFHWIITAVTNVFLLGAGYLVLTEAHQCQKTYPVLVRKNKKDQMGQIISPGASKENN